jgi:hypothetical protein
MAIGGIQISFGRWYEENGRTCSIENPTQRTLS